MARTGGIDRIGGGGRGLRLLLLSTLVALAAAAAACSSSGGTSDQATATSSQFKPVITLAVNDWTASALDVAIAEQLIEHELGYPVVPTRVDDATAMYQDLAAGKLDAVLEIWPDTITASDQRYFDRGQVAKLGPLGPVGQVGWYVPRYVVDAHPELASWTGYRDPAAASLFATGATAPRGRLLGVDPGYRQYDEQIVANLGLPLTVEFSGSEEATVAALAASTAARQPILVYWWIPTAAAATYDLVKVALPEADAACAASAQAGDGKVACDYPAEPLLKAASPNLATKAPDVARFLGAFTLSTDDQLRLLASVEHDGTTIAAAATGWIDTHHDTWQPWIAG